MNQSTQNPLPAIRVAKIEECQSLSGLSQLGYHVGYESDSKSIYFRIVTNSGNGKFNADWVGLADIAKCLTVVRPEGAFKASVFDDLLPGRSVNTPAFIAAALLAEGLIRRSDKVPRQYERNETEKWGKEIQALIAANTDLSVPPIGAIDPGKGKSRSKAPTSATA